MAAGVHTQGAKNPAEQNPAGKRTPPGGTLGWVGPYQLLERLPYQGGPIEYRARQRGPFGFERSCRLKLVPLAHQGCDQRVAEAIAREAKVILRLDHPSIVHLYDLFEHGQNLVLVMEHFSSLSFARLLELLAKRRNQLEEVAVWHVGHRLFDALAHAHGVMDGLGAPAPVVHSDIRPENLLVAADGRVRLAGFGFARHGDVEDSTACAHLGQGQSYVAPEQLHGRSLTERVDVFAGALILWELLTGRSASPEGLSDVERLRYLATRQVEPLRTLRPDLPPLVTTALDACLAVDPRERTIQAEEVAGCLAAAMDLRAGERALQFAVVSLGALWEGLAAGDPSSSPAPRLVKSGPPSTRREKSPAFSVMIAPSHKVPSFAPSVPLWEETTKVPRASQTQILDPVRISPAVAIAQKSVAPRPNLTSLAPTVASSSKKKRVPPNPRHGFHPWILAVPVAMVVAVLSFMLAGTSGQPDTASPANPNTASVAQGMGSPEGAEALPPARTASSPILDSSHEIAPVEASATVEPVHVVPSDRAVLIVESPPEGWVYIQGVLAGRTGEPIETQCGRRFVRVGTELGDHGMLGVQWLAPGHGVLLRCGDRLVVPANPGEN